MNEDTRPIEAVEAGYVVIDRIDCLKCAHLAPGVAKTLYTCTADNGNPNCPAQALTIIIGTNVEKAARAITNSLMENDFEKASRNLGRLGTYHEVIQAQVMAEVRENLINSEIARHMTEDHDKDIEPELPEVDEVDAEPQAPVQHATDAEWES